MCASNERMTTHEPRHSFSWVWAVITRSCAPTPFSLVVNIGPLLCVWEGGGGGGCCCKHNAKSFYLSNCCSASRPSLFSGEHFECNHDKTWNVVCCSLLENSKIFWPTISTWPTLDPLPWTPPPMDLPPPEPPKFRALFCPSPATIFAPAVVSRVGGGFSWNCGHESQSWTTQIVRLDSVGTFCANFGVKQITIEMTSVTEAAAESETVVIDQPGL